MAEPGLEAIEGRVRRLFDRVHEAEQRAGLALGAVRVIAISKTKPVEAIIEAYKAGICEFGENYVQEAETKVQSLPDGTKLHLVGGLQRNKARKAAGMFSFVQSIDSERTAEALNRACLELGRRMDVLVQVNMAAEQNKNGVAPDELDGLLAGLERFGSLNMRGIMVIPPFERSSAYFPAARALFEEQRAKRRQHGGFDVLSMGMSADFEAAISEGSTMVRIGRAIFGER